MASGRFLSTSIAEDERLSKLSMTAEFIFLKTIPHLDRDGMITGKPGLLYSRVCPAREELFGNLLALVEEWIAVGLVIRFDSQEGPVLFFPGFLKNNTLAHYDRERPSKFPPPPGYYRFEGGILPVGVEPTEKRSKSRTPANKSQYSVDSEVLESVQDTLQDEVQDFDLQEQEQEEDQDKEQDKEQEKQGDEDDSAPARDPIHAAWFETYTEELPDHLEKSIAKLLKETSEAAVIHGIRESINAESRSFRFIGECARNYIPPAPQQNTNYANGNGAYHVDIPGVVHMTPASNAPPASRPLPRTTTPETVEEIWAAACIEIAPMLANPFWLQGSTLTENGELAGVPFYRIGLTVDPGRIEWIGKQAESAIRRTLSSFFGKRVAVEFVAAEKELT